MDQSLILDRYRPLAELGSGGHATVTLAYDTRMGRRVAIKRLPLPRDAHGRPVRTGLAEARTVAMLNHPAIVTVYEWESDADEAFLIMEPSTASRSRELLDHLGRLDLDEAAAVLEPVADALAFAHDNGVLHLDIKPANVLVTRDGAVKVTDFGISALTGVEGTASAAEGTSASCRPSSSAARRSTRAPTSGRSRRLRSSRSPARTRSTPSACRARCSAPSPRRPRRLPSTSAACRARSTTCSSPPWRRSRPSATPASPRSPPRSNLISASRRPGARRSADSSRASPPTRWPRRRRRTRSSAPGTASRRSPRG